MQRNTFSVSMALMAFITAIVVVGAVPEAQAGSGKLQPPVSYATGVEPFSLVVADFNQDGKLDLAVANCGVDQSCNTGMVSVLLGNGDGTFQPSVNYAAGGWPIAIACGDFNGDDKVDLVTTSWLGPTANTVSVLLGNGDGTFQAPVEFATGQYPFAVAVGDFNGDGKLDLVTTSADSLLTVSVLLGNGDGTFQQFVDYPAGLGTNWVAVGDFNGDGKLDLATADNSNAEFGNVAVMLGNGDGSFQAPVEYSVGILPMYVAVSDLNKDGKQDLVVDNYCGTESCQSVALGSVSVLLGNGDGTFQPSANYVVGYEPRSTAVADVNGDGNPDLVVGNNASDSVSVLLGNGDGTFQPAVNYPTGFNPYSLAIADFNHDRAPDVVTANASGASATVLLNSGGTYLKLTSSANPSALGQAVTFTLTVAATFSTPGKPSGTVYFMDGTAKLGTVSLLSGKASFTTSNLAQGSHKITAAYSGDANFNRNWKSLVQQVQ
jgi:hypothetical protein